MKVYSEQVIKEVEQIISAHSGNLVLVKGMFTDEEETSYFITDKLSHSFFMIDDEQGRITIKNKVTYPAG